MYEKDVQCVLQICLVRIQQVLVHLLRAIVVCAASELINFGSVTSQCPFHTGPSSIACNI